MKRYPILLMFLYLFLSIATYAQSGPPGNGGPPSPPSPGSSGSGNVNDVSITAFLWLLALAGAYLGFKSSKKK